MNTATKQAMLLLNHYRIAPGMVDEVIQARAAGRHVMAFFDSASGVLAACEPAARKATFWDQPNLEKHLRNLAVRTGTGWGKHLALLHDLKVAEINFPALAADLLERMTRMLCDGEAEPAPEPLPAELTVDLTAPERAKAAWEHRQKVDSIYQIVRQSLYPGMLDDIRKTLIFGEHPEDHANSVTITEERVSIDLRAKWEGHTRTFSADSDKLGAEMLKQWKRRGNREGNWCDATENYPMQRAVDLKLDDCRYMAARFLREIVSLSGLNQTPTVRRIS